MASIVFATRVREDGRLDIPPEALAALGLTPGDEVEVQLDTKPATLSQMEYNQVFEQLLVEAERVAEVSQPVPVEEDTVMGKLLREKFRQQGFTL